MKILSDWTIRFKPNSIEGYCCRKTKQIYIGVNNSNIIRLLLHEIAHIKKYQSGNQHNQRWFNGYIKLHNKFLKKTPISKSDQIIIKIYKLKGKRGEEK